MEIMKGRASFKEYEDKLFRNRDRDRDKDLALFMVAMLLTRSGPRLGCPVAYAIVIMRLAVR